MSSDAATKGAKAPKKPVEHPKYIEMITVAISTLKERGGSSRQAILKYIQANYKVGDTSSALVKQNLKKGVANAVLVQPKGTGASGSFKLAKPVVPKKPATTTKKAAAKPKKKTETKPKKTDKKSTAKTAKSKKGAGAKSKAASKKTSAKKGTTAKGKKTTAKATTKKVTKKTTTPKKKTTTAKKSTKSPKAKSTK